MRIDLKELGRGVRCWNVWWNFAQRLKVKDDFDSKWMSVDMNWGGGGFNHRQFSPCRETELWHKTYAVNWSQQQMQKSVCKIKLTVRLYSKRHQTYEKNKVKLQSKPLLKQLRLQEWTVQEICSLDTSQTTCNSTSSSVPSEPTHRRILPAQLVQLQQRGKQEKKQQQIYN